MPGVVMQEAGVFPESRRDRHVAQAAGGLWLEDNGGSIIVAHGPLRLVEVERRRASTTHEQYDDAAHFIRRASAA